LLTLGRHARTARDRDGENLMATTIAESTSTSIVNTLNACIRACIDGERGYRAAAADVHDPMLRAKLEKYATERAGFASSLVELVESFGGRPAAHGTARGAAHRGFLEARAATERATDAVVLGECERGKLGALAAYDRAFEKTPLDTLPIDVRSVVVKQRAAIQTAYDDVTRIDVGRRRGQA
jgi:uncharacterized protein (TIGR02284 family)